MRSQVEGARIPKVTIEIDTETNSTIVYIKSQFLKRNEELTKPEIIEAILRQTDEEEALEKVRKDRGGR